MQTQIDCHRRAAIDRAIEFLSDKPVHASASEHGYYELFELETGRVIIRAGDEAGSGSHQEFNYEIPVATHKYAVLVWAHTHPAVRGRDSATRALNRANRRPSRVDNTNLIPYAPLVLKAPDGKIRVYPRRNDKPFSQLS